MSFDSDTGGKRKYEIKNSSGRAFKNDRAREGGKDAHFAGTYVDEGGAEHFLDLWVNAKDENVQARLIEAIKYINIRTKKKTGSPKSEKPTSPSFLGSSGYQTSFDASPGAHSGESQRKITDDDFPF